MPGSFCHGFSFFCTRHWGLRREGFLIAELSMACRQSEGCFATAAALYSTCS